MTERVCLKSTQGPTGTNKPLTGELSMVFELSFKRITSCGQLRLSLKKRKIHFFNESSNKKCGAITLYAAKETNTNVDQGKQKKYVIVVKTCQRKSCLQDK